MNKKFISSVLAGTMAVSTMGVVASAAVGDGNTDSGNVALTAKASMLEAVIDANLPTELETFINPYGAVVAAKTTETFVATTMYADGLISPTYVIENLDGKALKVTATAKITGSSTVALMTKPMDDAKLEKATEKQVFAFLNTTTTSIADKEPLFASTKYINNDNQLAFTEDGAKAAGIMTIPAAATAGTADKDAKGYFYVGGQCTPNPEEAWTSKDTVTVDLILDLSPSAGEAADVTMKSIAIDGGAKIEFDAATTAYEIAATGSKTKAVSITATANDDAAVIYVAYNGKVVNATADQTAAKDKIGVDAAAASVEVTPALNKDTGGTAVDYKVGDVLSFIVYNSTTHESATYTITFTE